MCFNDSLWTERGFRVELVAHNRELERDDYGKHRNLCDIVYRLIDITEFSQSAVTCMVMHCFHGGMVQRVYVVCAWLRSDYVDYSKLCITLEISCIAVL